jgi:Flp pilus assembly pilin Flp
MRRVKNLSKLNNRVGHERGQTMSEYAVVLLMISAATVATFGVFSTSVANLVNNVAGLLP